MRTFLHARPFFLAGVLVVAGVLACGRKTSPPEPASSASASPAGSASELEVGKPAPDFSATAHDGANLKLSELKGKPVVIYFYPKDETPGCTIEASSFRDAHKDLAAAGAVVIGVSTDSLDSHKVFAQRHELPFHLVSDPDGAIGKLFGVPRNGAVLARQTIVVGADGNVKKIYRKVDVPKHGTEVLADVRS